MCVYVLYIYIYIHDLSLDAKLVNHVLEHTAFMVMMKFMDIQMRHLNNDIKHIPDKNPEA